MKIPKLTLVGAGPGDPELISLKGIKALADADVVLYDALVNEELLAHAPQAKKVFVGKRAGKHHQTQTEIHKLIVDYALTDGHVVRLKGGDPFIFAHGKEELEHAETFGIKTESVLGISSVNLPGYYGIPLTMRGINESFWVITATNSKKELSNDLHLAAQSSATIVLLMGLRKLEEIGKVFNHFNKGNTSAAIISKGSTMDGSVHFGKVRELAQLRDENKIVAPSLVVIGETVGTHEYFYEKAAGLKETYL